ncbi:GNAT family N-acetyltransferase [Leuconostoc suionicum]|uniref:GNAT family N-acetyltransferase n=1 Tax=Leuconostoc suionicum TaxID=1511761 RepID=UPI00233E9E6E|nr:GNAT family N-acetyltransferase [Leuconostoc suionicum]MDC2805880.1 GNAT family N-acetyltransferase [Leuconostoc suionicum]MDC2823392.1 GNAT family N-acetyltransferase [Leuconostoc suionicum]
MQLKLLDTPDFLSYKMIRLEALKTDPISFGSTLEEEMIRTDEYFKNKVSMTPKHFVMGLYDLDKLVAVAVFTRETSLKESHKGEITSVYCMNEYRKQGLTTQLLIEVLKRAISLPDLKIIKLTVLSQNTSAQKLYTKLGFKTYGREPNSLYDGQQYYDEDLMFIDSSSFQLNQQPNNQ